MNKEQYKYISNYSHYNYNKGLLPYVHPSVEIGEFFAMGLNVIIEEDVVIGDNVVFGHNILLKPGTKIGNNTFIDSGVICSGDCEIGNNCQIRYNCIIARKTKIGDNVFLSAGVKTIYLNPKREGGERVVIMDNCFLGDDVVVDAGVIINKGCIIGAKSLVLHSTGVNKLYFGIPARMIRELRKDELYIPNID